MNLNRVISKYKDVMLPVLVVLSILMLVIPLPPYMLDLLISINISLSLLILLTTFFVKDALEFASFPTLILILTLFRLAINVSTTRSILLHADAGHFIRTFGNFVVQGNYVVGFVIFLILVIINYVVVAHGAQRIGEVAARFTLDAMPGKQMSIDADLNAGLITEEEARERRRRLEMEADFFGAMDGAGRFVQRDAIAGLIISIINVAAGLVIGVVSKKMDLSEALHTYTLLTVGDGLASQIPSFLLSTATGMMVTNAVTTEGVGSDAITQLKDQPKAIGLAAIFTLLLFFVPGMPKLSLLAVSGTLGYLYFYLSKITAPAEKEEEEKRAEEEKEEEREKEFEYALDPIELEIGYSLIPFIDPQGKGDLLERIRLMRAQIFQELGFKIPPIRIRDNIRLKPNEYVIKINGTEVAKGEVLINYLLAMNPQGSIGDLEGIRTKEPAFGLDAIWILPEEKEKAEMHGYTVVDPVSVLTTHLSEVCKRHSHELLDKQYVRDLIDAINERYPAILEDVYPDVLKLTHVQKVLQNLLRENVPIRNIKVILETLADKILQTQDPDTLTEHVRVSLAREISHRFAEDGVLTAITLDSDLEKHIASSLQNTSIGVIPVLEPALFHRVLEMLKSNIEKARSMNYKPVVLVSFGIRLYFKRLIEKNFPDLPVLSYSEVTPDITVRTIGMITFKE